ncbi:hypothetical protein [Kribbella yunnanensis]
MRVDDARAALLRAMGALDAGVRPVLGAFAQLVLLDDRAHPRIAPYQLRVAFGAYVEASRLAADSSTQTDHAFGASQTPQAVKVRLSLAKEALDRCVADLDRPDPEPVEDSGPGQWIGARPSAGPRFSEDGAKKQREVLREALYEQALPFAEAVGAEMAGATEPAGVPGPFADVREPWLRRVLRRGRRSE